VQWRTSSYSLEPAKGVDQDYSVASAREAATSSYVRKYETWRMICSRRKRLRSGALLPTVQFWIIRGTLFVSQAPVKRRTSSYRLLIFKENHNMADNGRKRL